MNMFKHGIGCAVILFNCVNQGIAQRMIFSGDSIVTSSCELYIHSLDTIRVYNNTDAEILVRWELTQYQFPSGGGYTLIFEPNQYPPSASHGNVPLEARDTAWIIFYMFHDTLIAGDSALVQIKVFDPLDSVNTSQFLTAIQYCPSTTSYTGPEPGSPLRVYPNPVSDESIIVLPENLTITSLQLYNSTGILVSRIPVTNHEISFSRDGLPDGLYLLGWVQNGQVCGMTPVVFVK